MIRLHPRASALARVALVVMGAVLVRRWLQRQHEEEADAAKGDELAARAEQAAPSARKAPGGNS